MATNPNISELSEVQIAQRSFDGADDAIRVNVITGIITANNSSIGVNGAAIPASSTQIAGKNGSGNLTPVSVDNSGNINVNVLTNILPTGASTSALQTSGNASLASIDSKLTNPLPVSIASSVPVTGPLTDTQLRASAVPISASSLPLPSGAATSANQTTANTSLSSIDSKTPALGQALAAASVPVVLTASQLSTLTPLSSISVSNFPADADSLAQGSATSGQLGSLIMGAVTTTAPGYTTAQTSPLSLTTSGLLRVDGSSATQPISGTVTANQGGTWNINNISGTISLPTGAATAAGLTAINTTLGSPFQAGGSIGNTSFIATQATGTNLHTVVDSVSGTVAISAASLPLPAGAATSANQTTANTSLSSIDSKTPALGQALAASSVPVVLTASQLSTLTPLSSVTVTQATGTNLHTVIDSGAVTVSGSVSVSNFPADADALAQGSTTSGQLGSLIMGAVTTAAPTYTTAQTNPLSLTPSGSLRIDGSSVTQPISGTVTANAGTNLNTSALALSATQTNGTQKTQIVDGAGNVVGPEQTIAGTNYFPVVLAASGTSGSALVPRSIQIAGSDGTNTQTISVDSTGKLNINNISGTVSLPTGAATSALQTTANTSLSSIDAKTPALGQALAAASTPVVLTAAQLTTLTPLSSVTVTQATGTNLHTVVDSGTLTAVTSITNALPAGTNVIGHVITDTGSTTAVTGNVTVVQPTGTNLHTVIDSGTITSITNALPSGTNTIGTVNSTISGSPGRANAPTVTTYATPITSAAYVTIIASTTSATNLVEIFDSSGVSLFFATGAAASEVDQFVIYPGGNGQIPFQIPAGTRISYKAVSTSATGATAYNVLNLYK